MKQREFWLLQNTHEEFKEREWLTYDPKDGAIHVREVSPEYDKAVEVMREALEESECDCTDANHVTGLMVKDECFRCQALAAFEKAKGVK